MRILLLRFAVPFGVLVFLAPAAFAPPAFAQSVFDLPLAGRVMDRADLLAPDLEASLTEQLRQHEAATSNQVVVLTIPSLEGRSVEEVANRLFNRWALGQAARDNGVLLLIAREDRELRIEVGLGLEGDLTDAEAGRIIRNVIVPLFRADDYEGGITRGVAAILGTIEGTYTPPDDGSGDEETPSWFGLLFLCTHILLPGFLGTRALVEPPASRYVTFFFTLFFIVPMFLFFFSALFGFLPFGGEVIEGVSRVGLVLLSLYLLAWFGMDIYMSRSPKWQAIRKQVRAARKKGKKTKIDAGWISFSAGGSSSSGGGGGGFSGGGGSSGGGGASGSW